MADLIIALSLWHIPGAAGVLACLFYILTCDAFPGGRSPGKWLTGLKVVRLDRETMDYQASLVRNGTVAVPGPSLPGPRDRPAPRLHPRHGRPVRRGVPRVLRPGRAKGRRHHRRDAGGGVPADIRCQPFF